MDLPQSLGRNMRRKRQRLGKSQDELALDWRPRSAWSRQCSCYHPPTIILNRRHSSVERAEATSQNTNTTLYFLSVARILEAQHRA